MRSTPNPSQLALGEGLRTLSRHTDQMTAKPNAIATMPNLMPAVATPAKGKAVMHSSRKPAELSASAWPNPACRGAHDTLREEREDINPSGAYSQRPTPLRCDRQMVQAS